MSRPIPTISTSSPVSSSTDLTLQGEQLLVSQSESVLKSVPSLSELEEDNDVGLDLKSHASSKSMIPASSKSGIPSSSTSSKSIIPASSTSTIPASSTSSTSSQLKVSASRPVLGLVPSLQSLAEESDADQPSAVPVDDLKLSDTDSEMRENLSLMNEFQEHLLHHTQSLRDVLLGLRREARQHIQELYRKECQTQSLLTRCVSLLDKLRLMTATVRYSEMGLDDKYSATCLHHRCNSCYCQYVVHNYVRNIKAAGLKAFGRPVFTDEETDLVAMLQQLPQVLTKEIEKVKEVLEKALLELSWSRAQHQSSDNACLVHATAMENRGGRRPNFPQNSNTFTDLLENASNLSFALLDEWADKKIVECVDQLDSIFISEDCEEAVHRVFNVARVDSILTAHIVHLQKTASLRLMDIKKQYEVLDTVEAHTSAANAVLEWATLTIARCRLGSERAFRSISFYRTFSCLYCDCYNLPCVSGTVKTVKGQFTHLLHMSRCVSGVEQAVNGVLGLHKRKGLYTFVSGVSPTVHLALGHAREWLDVARRVQDKIYLSKSVKERTNISHMATEAPAEPNTAELRLARRISCATENKYELQLYLGGSKGKTGIL
jgi:hypothetical protein